MQQLINDILHDMSEVLSAKELYTLQIVLQKKLNTQNNQTYPYTNIEYMDMFIVRRIGMTKPPVKLGVGKNS